jgi:hypothetical protein
MKIHIGLQDINAYFNFKNIKKEEDKNSIVATSIFSIVECQNKIQ